MLKKRAVRSKVFGTALNDCIWSVQEWNLDIRKFEIYLTGERMDYSSGDNWDSRAEPGVEYQMASRLIKNLQILADLDSTRPILIHMKTNGGDWSEGMAIYDALYYSRNPIVILNYTHARSMSSIIFESADRRIMMPHSIFMFHEGTMAVSGTSKAVFSNVEWLKRDNPVMLEIYAARMKERGKYSKLPKADIKKMLQELMDKKEDVFLTAQQAVDWGLADALFDGDWQKLNKYVRRRPKR